MQTISELDQNGNWTDYIYAGGQKIAKAGPGDPHLHLSGTAGYNGAYAAFPLPTTPTNYTLRSGDKIVFRQYGPTNSGGGIIVNTSTATSGWSLSDSNGQPAAGAMGTGSWQNRSVDLTPLAGGPVQTIFVVANPNAGDWTLDFADLAIVSTDGTVIPLFNGQPMTLNVGPNQAGMSNVQQSVVTASEPGLDAGLHFYTQDHLGTAQLEFSSGGWPVWQGQFAPFGGELDTQTSQTHYKFTGKERDAESGNDYFGARYFASTMGRFLSPDWSAKAEPVPYAKLSDPQSLNLYSYVRNNPLSRIDADGHYELNASGCGDNSKCQKKYDKAANKFESRREKDLKSKNADVRAAAANYGARGEANGVHVGFANTAQNGILGSVDPSGSTPGNVNIQVTLDFGRAGSAETQTHEGTHVGDDQKFLNSYDPVSGGYNQALNPTHGQTEFNAFKAGAAVDQSHGFGPNDTQKILDFLHNSPVYGPIFNVPVFDPAKFPGAPPEDEQP